MAATLIKRPIESLLYDMDFSKLLILDEALTGVVAVVSEPPGLGIGTPVLAGATVQVRINDGLDGTVYEVKFTVETSRGNILHECGYLAIVDC